MEPPLADFDILVGLMEYEQPVWEILWDCPAIRIVPDRMEVATLAPLVFGKTE